MFKYGIAGFIASLVELVLLYLLVDFWHLWYLFGSAIAYLFGMILSFVGRKVWAFCDREMGFRILSKQLLLYTFSFVFGVILNLVVVYALVEWAQVHYLWAQFIAVSIVGFLGFAFNKAVTFNPKKK